MEENKTACCCGQRPTLIYSCSGAADVGSVADQSARQLARQGMGKMACLASVGARLPVALQNAQAAAAIVAIDGCPQHCARKTLEQAGLAHTHHVEITALGMPKGQTPPTLQAIAQACIHTTALLKTQTNQDCGQ